VAQELRVEGRIEPQRPPLRHAHEALRVERQPAAAGEERDRLEREVRTQQRPDMDPAGVGDRLAHVVRRPGVAQRLHLHPPLLTVVLEREGRRRRRLPPRHRHAEPDEPGQEVRAVLGGAAGHDHSRAPELPQRVGAVEGAAADARRPPGEEVAREVADDGQQGPRL
jgi:hypothetical protein